MYNSGILISVIWWRSVFYIYDTCFNFWHLNRFLFSFLFLRGGEGMRGRWYCFISRVIISVIWYWIDWIYWLMRKREKKREKYSGLYEGSLGLPLFYFCLFSFFHFFFFSCFVFFPSCSSSLLSSSSTSFSPFTYSSLSLFLYPYTSFSSLSSGSFSPITSSWSLSSFYLTDSQ